MTTLKAKQWEAARRTDEHLLVAAGAGTGKTTTVVSRILYLLGAEVNGERHGAPIALQQVGAITFTNAAAADLKRKLRKGLRDAGMRDIADEVDNARIGTIHSFCGDILREFALRAGRDPQARVLEESEAAALASEVARETLLAELERGTIPGLDELLTIYRVADIEGWVTRLMGDSDRLVRILDDPSPHNELERALLQLAERAMVALSARLGERAALDFDRMITWTRDLLDQQPSVRRALQRRLHTLILDEFQDVDPVQRQIAYLLGEPERRSPGTTRLMLVGDPKQSIYRFRRADVAVWSEVERDFVERGLGGMVALEENFRSVPPILGFVDAAIGPALDAPANGEAHAPFEVRFASVRPTRDAPAEPAIELLVVPPGPEGKRWKAEEARTIEAAEVARRARELRDAGVAPRHMAVLLAVWSDVAIYESALRAEGLPTYSLRAEGFYECREVLDLILALEVLRDPRDDRALFGWLRSPFVGVRDETLLALARAGVSPRWDHLDTVQSGEAELLRSASEILREHVALRDRIPTCELLERLIERTGYLGYLALCGEEGLQQIANVRKLIRMARQQPEQGVGDFLRAVREARARNEKEGSARLYGEGDDVVTITTIHSAKGLEWPVVFWCDLARMPRKGVDGSLVVGRRGIALKDPDAEQQSLQWTALCTAEEEEGHAERKRLWYVAATRARDRLILGGISPRMDARCPGTAIRENLGCGEPAHGSTVEFAGSDGRRWHALVRHCRIPMEITDEAAADGGGMGIAGVAELPALPELPAPLPAIPARIGRPRHSATSLMQFERCPRKHWFGYVAGLREPEVESGAGGAGRGSGSAIVRGQIVHDVLERSGLDDFDLLLEDAIGRWDPDAPTPEVPAGRRYREELSDEIRCIEQHPDYRALDDLPTAKRELGFIHLAGRETVVEGKIDLAARTADGVVLLDVKTYQGAGDALATAAARYALQRDAYVAAVEAIGGEPVARFAFQFSRAGTQLSEPVTVQHRSRAAERFTALFGSIGGAEPALATDVVECRRCGYRAVGWCPGADGAGT